jgi:hypothetical protein
MISRKLASGFTMIMEKEDIYTVPTCKSFCGVLGVNERLVTILPESKF